MLIAEFSRLSSTIMTMKKSHGYQLGMLQESLESKQLQIEKLEAKLKELSSAEDEDDQMMVEEEEKESERELDSKRSISRASFRSTPAASPDLPIKSHFHSAAPHFERENGLHSLPPYFPHASLRIPGFASNNPQSFLHGMPFPVPDRQQQYRFGDDLGSMSSASMVGRLSDSLIPKSDPMEAKIQEMLRYNLDKYANQNLDTLHISRRVRELLSVHNIGQRVFAKYVLGLSQGTVSELLSKPKPWDKLTEKGRDSYRKMHAWIVDNQAVLLIKSLVPKRGKRPFAVLIRRCC